MVFLSHIWFEINLVVVLSDSSLLLSTFPLVSESPPGKKGVSHASNYYYLA